MLMFSSNYGVLAFLIVRPAMICVFSPRHSISGNFDTKPWLGGLKGTSTTVAKRTWKGEEPSNKLKVFALPVGEMELVYGPCVLPVGLMFCRRVLTLTVGLKFCRWDSNFAGGTQILPVGLKFCQWDSNFAGGSQILPVGLNVGRWDSNFAGGTQILPVGLKLPVYL